MKMEKALLTLLLCGLFLLLLSALVVAPETEAALAETAPPTETRLTAWTLPAADAAPRQEMPVRVLTILLVCVQAVVFCRLSVTRDANGRVLRQRRYLDGAYVLFRQEAACG